MADLEAYLLDPEYENVFSDYYNEDHHNGKDYKQTKDRIDDKFAFYNTQYNYISELKGVDMMKKADVDFSDFEAIQNILQEQGDRDSGSDDDRPSYKQLQKDNEKKREKLKDIVIDQQIAPEVFGKKIRKDIVDHQALLPEDIIYNYKARKTLEELFFLENGDELGYDELMDDQALGKNPTRLLDIYSQDQDKFLPEQELSFLSKEMKRQKSEVLNLHVEYLQRKDKMFALFRYVVRDKQNHSLKTVMRIFNFVKPYKQDEQDQADQNLSNASIMEARNTPKRSMSFSFRTPKNKDKGSKEVSFVETDIKIGNDKRPKQTGITNEILHAETVIGETSELAQTYAMAYNQMTLKYGQWVFYYIINKKSNNTEEIKLMMFDLDNVDEEPTQVDHEFLKEKTMQVYAPKMKTDEKVDPDAEAPEEFQTLKVHGTVGIIFNVKSQFIGDNSCNLEISEQDAKKWIKKQYVIFLSKGQKLKDTAKIHESQVEQSQVQGEQGADDGVLVTSIRRSEEVTNYITAVQTPFQKTENNANLGYHHQVLREGVKSDFFTINVNSRDFVFNISSKTHNHQHKEETKFETRAEKIKALRRATVYKKHVISEYVGHEVDFEHVKRQASIKKEHHEIATLAQRRQTIQFMRADSLKQKENAFGNSAEVEKENDQIKTEISEEESGESETEMDNYPKDSNAQADLIDFEDEMEECFVKWITKVQTTPYSLYQIRNNHSRNYVYKSHGEKYEPLMNSLYEKQPKKLYQNNRKNLGFNLMLIQKEKNSEQTYYFQCLEKREQKGKDIKYYMKFFVSKPKQNIKYRVIEQYDRLHQHPLSRGLMDSGMQEVIQLHPYFGNVFVDSDKYFLKDDQSKKLIIQTRDMNILIYNKKHYFSFFDTLPQKNSKTIRTFYDNKRKVQVRLQKYDKVHDGQRKLVLEIWNNSPVPYTVKTKKLLNFKPQIEYQDGEVLHQEIVQSSFFDDQSLQEFSNFCPSSAIEKVKKDDPKDGTFKQRYQVLTLEDVEHGQDDEDYDKDLIYRIYEYELTWNENKPTKKNTLLRLVGRKQIIFNDQHVDRFCILAPYYPDKNNYIITGTQLLKGHNENTIILDNFNAIDFQFKTGICNSGYKIYQDTKDDTDWKCILIESQINTCALPPGHKDDAVTVEEREKCRDHLTNHDLMRMYEYQFNVIFNMVPFDPLDSITLLDDTLDNARHDHFSPLEILNGNSIVDFILFHPQAVQEASGQSDCFPSLVDQFIRNQVEVRPQPGDKENTHFYEILDAAFGKNKSWYRKPNEVWQDLVQTNPLYRCYDQNEMNIAITAITGAFITKQILKQKMTMYNYEMVLQVLPIVIDTKQIDISEYANYFIDAPNAINFGVELENGIEIDGKLKNLPKFAYEDYEIKELFSEGKVSELDLRKFAARHIITLDMEDQEIHEEEEQMENKKAEDIAHGRKRRLHSDHDSKGKLILRKECSDSDDDEAKEKCENDEVILEIDQKHSHVHNHHGGKNKDTHVKYFLVDFDSMAYMSKMRYIQGVNDEKIIVTERVFADYMFKINEVFFDYFDQAPILQNLMNIKFIETQKFFAVQMAVMVFLFIAPFITQMFWTGNNPWWIRSLVFVSQGAQIFFTVIMYTLMTALGPREYFSDMNNVNQLLISCFFPVYTFFRFFNTTNMLPTEDGELTQIYAFFLFSNCFIIISMTFKVFSLMKVDPKFGLLVQLVTTALYDCINFTIFMFIWITVFSLILRILGADTNKLSDKFPDIDMVSAFFLQTFENGIGNIRNPTYSLWIEKYKCEVPGHDDVFLCDRANIIISIVSIYAIYFTWFLNQMVVFIILVNFLIVYIGNSYQNVMDSALKFKYQQICQQTKEYSIIRQRFYGAKIIMPFVLVANVEEEGDDASFGGLVSQILDFVRKSNRTLKKEIDAERDIVMKTVKAKYQHFDNSIAETNSQILKEIKTTSETLDAGIQNVKKDMSRVKESLTVSIQTQKQDVEEDFNKMWEEMMSEFNDLSGQMRDDMSTYKKEFGVVKDDVRTFGTSMTQNFNNVKNRVNDQLNTVTGSINGMNANVAGVGQSVKDVGAGVEDAGKSAQAGLGDVNSNIGGVGDALNDVKKGVMGAVDSVQEGIDKVKGNVDAVANNVETTNANVASKAAAANEKAAKAEADFQQMQIDDAKRQEELEKRAEATESKNQQAKKLKKVVKKEEKKSEKAEQQVEDEEEEKKEEDPKPQEGGKKKKKGKK